MYVPTPLHIRLYKFEDEVWDSLALSCRVPSAEELLRDEYKENGDRAGAVEAAGV